MATATGGLGLQTRPKPKPAPKPAASTVPLNPGLRKGDQQLAAYLRKLYGPVQSNAQIQQQASSTVKAQIDPVLAEIARSNQAATDRGSAALNAATAGNVAQLNEIPGQVRSDYAQASAEDQQAADALSSFLQGQGQAGQSELSGKLNAAGAPAAAVTGVAGGAAALGQGAGGEAAARGYSTRSRTIAGGAGETAYARELPGIAAMQGKADLSKYLTDQAAALADAQGQVRSQVPGIVSGVTSDLTKGRADQRAAAGTALTSFLGGALDRNTQANIASAGFGKDVYGINVGAQSAQNVADTRAAAAAAKAAASKKGKQDKTHATALKNTATAKVTAGKSILKLAQTLTKPQHRTVLKQTSKFAPPTKVQVPIPPPDYGTILNRVMALPEVTILSSRYGVRPVVLQELVANALRAGGVYPGYKLKPIGKPRPNGQPGKQPGEPPH